jgi:hypothetical protein
MAKTKLTLSIEKSLITKGKSFAKNTGRSLSELVEHYLDTLTSEKTDNEHISPKLKKIIGAVKLPEDFDEEKELAEYHSTKITG